MYKKFFMLLLYIFVAESTKNKYVYVPTVGRYIKMHRFAANWQEARLRCHLENGVLASPESDDMINVMWKIMEDNEVNIIHTGIHATYSKGDYTTITGTPLSELDVNWLQGEPDNLHNEEDCLAMHSLGGLSDVKCTNDYQFICYKLREKMNAHSCNYPQEPNSHSDYIMNNATGSCYKFHREGRSWPDSFKTCQAEDAYLAIINSDGESQYLKELFAQNQPHTIPGNFHKDAANIGITKWRIIQDWFTIHGQSLSEAGFSAFNAGEPNNVGNNENCVSVFRTGLLNDHNCGTLLTFICEKPIQIQEDLKPSANS